MVGWTLWYFVGPGVALYVRITVGYTWFCSLSMIVLVPADIWATITNKGGISFFWSWSYWSSFLLTWAVVPVIQGYEDAGDFTIRERLKTSAHVNLIYYVCVGSIALCGLILLIILHKDWGGNILGLAMACSNTFGLVTGAFLLGYGLSEIPKGIWSNANWTNRHKVLSHNVYRMAVKLDDAHQDFSNAIVVAQATSKQMSRRDPLKPYMNIIDKMLVHMLNEDPTFKPQGGKLGENDMDYDTDEKTMASLRRQLRKARERYYRYKSEYTNFVREALELEDTMKSYEHCSSNGWKYMSSFRPERKGELGPFLDVSELIWRCMLRKQLERLLAIILGCMSAAILVAEATILPSGVDLFLFSILVNIVGKHELLVQVAVLIPLMYMCVCTYYSLIKIGMLTFYALTPRQTSSVSLLMICSMVARYAPPICYNFLNLIHLENGDKTTFEKRMGNIDDAVPFFGKGFNKIYPLIMVIFTILVATNFFDRIIRYFGNWKIFCYEREAFEDVDGFNPSGLVILKKERSWVEQGHKVGELVVPLARSFHNATFDLEAGGNDLIPQIRKQASRLITEEGQSSHSQHLRSVTTQKDGGSREGTVRQKERETDSKSYDAEAQRGGNGMQGKRSSSGIASTWDSMKTGFHNFKSRLDTNRFIRLSQAHDTDHSRASSPESLDEIFERISSTRHTSFGHDHDLDDGVAMSIQRQGHSR
ncbi:LMBR1-like membrane protein [Perilla frutescens var. hirtella]|uniref:LMBR1-like membrane protein n=1 Tax=Perilla frutescens var. hirtella TaxID=608512 RepID=A0AAD4JGB3_PERFH|nr:LMBR1-like membrane protein [Perilla frutescens var. frutescens]KAH6793417.1 LMBR1-like membrane protein [Perilla frutescens var. hirtella]KAH6833266.1 LMBR1-like membrane protein [Perilla frutescens var. hirtella]